MINIEKVAFCQIREPQPYILKLYWYFLKKLLKIWAYCDIIKINQRTEISEIESSEKSFVNL